MLEFGVVHPLSKEEFMKLVASTLMAGAFLAATSLPVLSDGHIAGAIKARQALMTLYAANLGALGAMAKGDVEYKAETASAAANNLQALVNLSTASWWIPGSDSTAMPGKTRAKKEMWDTYPAVVEKSKALNMAVADLAKTAGSGLDGLRAAMGPVGAACGGCHKPYREEKK